MIDVVVAADAAAAAASCNIVFLHSVFCMQNSSLVQAVESVDREKERKSGGERVSAKNTLELRRAHWMQVLR